MPSVEGIQADLDVLDRSLVANQSGVIARGRLRLLRRAVDCFGFHLARLDMRQNSVVHERTVAELLDAAKPGTSYLALNEEARIAQLAARIAQRAAAYFDVREIQRGDESASWMCSTPLRRRTRGSAPTSIPQCIISMCEGVSDLLEVALLLKEVGLVDPSGRSAINIVPLFETIEDLQALCCHHGPVAVAARNTAGWWTAAAACCRK